jgi:mRNA interferase MazF
VEVSRFDVVLVRLDPTVGSEIRKTLPCVVVSPDEANRHLSTVLIVPLTTGGKLYPTRVQSYFQGKLSLIAIDQMRAIDKSRMLRWLGRLEENEQVRLLAALAEFFEP